MGGGGRRGEGALCLCGPQDQNHVVHRIRNSSQIWITPQDHYQFAESESVFRIRISAQNQYQFTESDSVYRIRINAQNQNQSTEWSPSIASELCISQTQNHFTGTEPIHRLESVHIIRINSRDQYQSTESDESESVQRIGSQNQNHFSIAQRLGGIYVTH